MKNLKQKEGDKKQVSIVLEVSESFDELDLIIEAKKFFQTFEGVNIVGTHIKLMKEKKPYGQYNKY